MQQDLLDPRGLQSETTLAPTLSPLDFGATGAPTAFPAGQPPSGYSSPSIPPISILILVLIALVVVFLLYILWRCYRRGREQRMLDLRSRQADRVLGDMQMVPNDDLDNEML